MLYSFFWVNPRHLNFMCRRFGALCFIFICGGAYTTYEDGKECSETSAHKIRRPGNHPNKQYNVQNMANV